MFDLLRPASFILSGTVTGVSTFCLQVPIALKIPPPAIYTDNPSAGGAPPQSIQPPPNNNPFGGASAPGAGGVGGDPAAPSYPQQGSYTAEAYGAPSAYPPVPQQTGHQ